MESLNDSTSILIKNITDSFLVTLKQQVTKLVSDNVTAQLQRLDVATLTREHLTKVLNSNAKTYNFPDRSIKGSSVSPDGLYLKADQIAGGVYRNFESTGIQDKATDCQVTILDNATVFENQLVAKTLHVAGDTIVEGNISVTGTLSHDSSLFKAVVAHSLDAVRGEMKDGLLASFRDQVFEKISSEGIDPANIKISGKALVENNTLAPSVLFTNIQKVGALKSLQVVGETLLDETLYVSTRRVGINTLEPAYTFDLWDQEIEITAGKFTKDAGVIGTPRPHHLILSSNKNQNLILCPDGSVSIELLRIGSVSHSSADKMPEVDAPKGHVVWNSDPKLNDAIGWVSLGGARWAKFGTITG